MDGGNAENAGAIFGRLRHLLPPAGEGKTARLPEIDATGEAHTIRFAGSGAEVNAFLAELESIARVLELARSGTAALERGEAVLMPAA